MSLLDRLRGQPGWQHEDPAVRASAVDDLENDAQDVFEAIAEALARGEDVRIAGFGTFGTRSRPARTGRNPRTGESLEIAASTAPTFKAGKPLRDAVNAGRGS